MAAKHQVDDLRRAKRAAHTFVSGHTLDREGASTTCADCRHGCACGAFGWTGHGRCSCGQMSSALPSNNARKAWHRQHKLEVLAEIEEAS